MLLPKLKLKTKINFSYLSKFKILIFVLFFIIIAGVLSYESYTLSQNIKQLDNLSKQNTDLKTQLNETSNSLTELENQDQVKINKDLKEEIDNINKTYNQAVETYEKLLKYKAEGGKNTNLDKMFTNTLVYLSQKNYASASAETKNLNSEIDTENAKLASSFQIPVSTQTSNTPPGSGYSRQSVTTDAGNFLVSMIAADLSSTKVIVDTASDSDCGNDCPVLPLSSYVSRNGAFAGVNGSYFCPATYPSCAGKTNSFDLLLMNKNKTYFNSSNNVYSSNPAVVFGDNYIRFVRSASEWGRDTSVNGVLSNYPLLVMGGDISFTGDSDSKQSAKGSRSFVANRGNTVYIGVVSNVTVAESAKVMKALGMENAINLDDGGSTALWYGGYKVGPGRDLPNVILFVKK